jgi:hypothetical protein
VDPNARNASEGQTTKIHTYPNHPMKSVSFTVVFRMQNIVVQADENVKAVQEITKKVNQNKIYTDSLG